MRLYYFAGCAAIGAIAGGLINLGVPIVIAGIFIIVADIALYYKIGKP